jgi:hypothetical protein
MRFALSVLVALCSLCGAPLAARAQTPNHLTRNAEAVASGQRGLEAYKNDDWATAYSLFHRAETLAHSPVFLLYMARARERQGASSEALDLYARVARESLDGAPESWRSAVEQASREGGELRTRLANEGRNAADTRAGARASEQGQNEDRNDAAPSATRVAAFAAGAVGAAGLAVGAIAGIVAWAKLNELEKRCGHEGCDPADKPKLESVETWSRIADVGFVVGVTGMATSAVFFWVVPAASADAKVPIRTGVAARVRF